jgi:hypothetical protein
MAQTIRIAIIGGCATGTLAALHLPRALPDLRTEIIIPVNEPTPFCFIPRGTYGAYMARKRCLHPARLGTSATVASISSKQPKQSR